MSEISSNTSPNLDPLAARPRKDAEKVWMNVNPDRIRGFSHMVWAFSIILGLTAISITLRSVPFQNERNALAVMTSWFISLGILSSALVLQRGNVIASAHLMLGSTWAGVLAGSFFTNGFGMLFGIGSIVVSAAIAVQVVQPRLFNRVLLLGVLVGLTSFFVDILSPLGRQTNDWLVRLILFLAVGMTILVFLWHLLRRLSDDTLLVKLVVPFVLVALSSIGILASINYLTTRAALEEAANQTLNAAASQVALRVDVYIKSIQEALVLEARLPVFIDYLTLPEDQKYGSREERDAMAMLRNLQSRGYILSYSLMDQNGKVLLDTGVPARDYPQIPFYLGLVEIDPTYFRLMMMTERPYVSPVVFSKETGEPHLYFATRINDQTGNAVGILVSRYHASNLQSIIVMNNDLAGPGSFAVLVDENHLRLAQGIAPEGLYKFISLPEPEDQERLLANLRIPKNALYQPVQRFPAFTMGLARSEHSPFFSTREIGTGDEINSVAAVHLESRPWLVAFLQPQSIYLTPIREQTRNAVLLAVVIGGLTSLAATLIARLIINPITRLTSVAEKGAAGDLKIRAPVESRDEIGVLANAFNSMTGQLRHSLEELEQRVAERTLDLARASEEMKYRANQLQSVAQVAHTIGSIQDIDQLLPIVTKSISEQFGFYHVGIFLLDNRKEYAILRAANSEGGQRMLAKGHRLKLGVGIVGYTVAHGEGRIALDVGKDAVYFDNPDLPETRSEMALPLKMAENVIGALDVQSKEAGAFKDEDVALLSTLAEQVAITIENARLFGETRRALTEIQTAQRQYLRQEWEKLTKDIQQSGFAYASGKLVPILPEEENEPWEIIDQAAAELVSTGSWDAMKEISGSDSILNVPVSLRGQVIGLIQLEEGGHSRKWTEEEMNLVKSVADQVGLALENARLLEETHRRAEREHLVTEITSKLRATNDPEEILNTAVYELRQVLRARSAQVIVPSVRLVSQSVEKDKATHSDGGSGAAADENGMDENTHG